MKNVEIYKLERLKRNWSNSLTNNTKTKQIKFQLRLSANYEFFVKLNFFHHTVCMQANKILIILKEFCKKNKIKLYLFNTSRTPVIISSVERKRKALLWNRTNGDRKTGDNNSRKSRTCRHPSIFALKLCNYKRAMLFYGNHPPANKKC